MRVLFLADSIDPGASGVGDYALRLAGQLRLMSVDALVEPIGAPGSPLRDSLAERVKRHQADWVSIQFVPYAYAHRGLVSQRSLPWSCLRGSRGTHIMFHELWIGAHCGASWYERGVGLLQRRGIKALMQALQPSRVHCSNSLYSAMLEREEIQHNLLPLFSGVPVLPVEADPYEEVVAACDPSGHRSGWIVSAIFGTIYPSSNLLPAVQWLNNLSRSQGKRLLVVSLGNCPSATSVFKQLEGHFPLQRQPTFLVKGPLNADHLSPWIRNADCALATTPFNIIQKSSSAATFVDHGVPVIVLDQGAEVRGLRDSPVDLTPAFWLFGDLRLTSGNRLPKRLPSQSRLPMVAAQFLEDLSG